MWRMLICAVVASLAVMAMASGCGRGGSGSNPPEMAAENPQPDQQDGSEQKNDNQDENQEENQDENQEENQDENMEENQEEENQEEENQDSSDDSGNSEDNDSGGGRGQKGKGKRRPQFAMNDGDSGDDSSQEGREERRDENLMARAKQSFREGKEVQGLIYLMAEAVVRGNSDVLDTLRWAAVQKQPLLAARWAIVTQYASTPNTLVRSRRGSGSEQPQQERGTPEEALRFWRELVIFPLMRELELRVANGQFGKWLGDDAWTSENPDDQNRSDDFDDHRGEDGNSESARRRGIVLFNANNLREMKQQLEKERVDLLLIADVAPKPVAKGPPQANLTLKLYDAATGTELWASKPLNSAKVIAAMSAPTRSRSNTADPAREPIEDFLKYVDTNLVLTDMPAISPAAAQRRADNLTMQKPVFPLPILFELRYYQQKELLTTDELATYYGKLIGEEQGSQLARGEETDRQRIIYRWLPKRGR